MGGGVALYATTNIDDLFLLSAFFADPHLYPRNIVIGQFLGIGVLTAVSIVAAAALAVPESWIAWSGLVRSGACATASTGGGAHPFTDACRGGSHDR